MCFGFRKLSGWVGTFWSNFIVLELQMRVESRVGEVTFPTSTIINAALFLVTAFSFLMLDCCFVFHRNVSTCPLEHGERGIIRIIPLHKYPKSGPRFHWPEIRLSVSKVGGGGAAFVTKHGGRNTAGRIARPGAGKTRGARFSR